MPYFSFPTIYTFLFVFFANIFILLPATAVENTDAFSATPLKFSHLTTADGLSQSYVFSIAQDKQGFIWIATEDGLDRYDGNSFIHYRHKANDNNSLNDNFIRKVFIDSDNIIWVATANGLSRYNRELDNFKNYKNISGDNHSLKDNLIWDIYQDNFKNLWISTSKGLHTYNTIEDNFTRIKIKGFENKLLEVKTIFQDNKNNYWMGTYDNGIFIINDKLSYAVSLKEKNKWNLNLSANGLYDFKIIENDYWLATDKGIFIISPDYSIKKQLNKNSSSYSLLSNEVRSITQVDDSNVWLATKEGLNLIDLSNYSIQSHQKSLYKNSLSENWIMDIYLDRSSKIWLGTYGGGITVYNPLITKFQQILNSDDDFRVESIAESSDGIIWFSTQQGELFKLTNQGQYIQVNTGIKEGISQILISNNNRLWLRTVNNTLYSYNYEAKLLTPHNNWYSNSNHPENNLLTIINDVIWFINSKGNLTSYNTNSHNFKKYSIKNKLNALGFDKNKKHSLISNIWLTTIQKELYKFNLRTKSFMKVDLNSVDKSSLSQTTNITVSLNWIWLGSNSQGVTLVNKNTLTVRTFDENNALKNNFIADILIDENESAWVSTNKGISLINPNFNKVNNFYNDFSILNTEFIIFSSLHSSSDQMYFGSSNGFYIFEPSDLSNIKQNMPSPFISNVFIANKKIPILKNNKIKADTFSIPMQINYLKNITLTYDQSPFSIEFISPNAKLPTQIKYRYRLLGLDDSWIEADSSYRRATYTNLSAGDYTFEVQVYDLYNPELIKSNQIKIQIMPPWWLSKSALFIYGLIILSFLAYIFQQMRHKRQYHLQIQQSEERLKLSLWGSGDEMWDWNITTGKIFRSNIWGILEFPQDGTRNSGGDKTNLHQHDIPRVKKALQDHFDRKTDHFEATYRVKDKDEKWIWVLDRGKVVERDTEDKPTRMTGTLKDISHIKKAEERLKLFAKCIENISDAVVIYNKQFITIDINKAFQRITGKTKTQMLGEPLKFNQYPESFCQNVKKHLINNGSWHGEIESTRENGKLYLTDLNIDIIRDENHNVSHFVGVFSDITKRKETEKELRTLANTDTLTGLPNRSHFQANQSILVKNKTPHALLVFDLDNFKKINDSLGHQVGDVLLCKVAQRILKIGRRKDTVYRLGGDEFSIIIENTNDIHTITTLAKTILKAIALPLKLRNQEIVLYGSIGIVLYPEDGATPHELLKNADTAMYHAKDLGGNKYQFFSESMNKQAVKRLQVESLIRHGLKDDLFSVYYQPKIEIATGKIAGMEALVRFKTPNKGLISPVVFIPIAEETGQIVDIGEVVLRKSCFATKRWVDAGLFDGRIAVNLSAVQFTQPNLVEIIASILIESNLPAKYLELEITEGTVMDSPQQAIDTMLKIRDMGIHLALDDFGTGYSSLAYLKKFPLNTLKIDKAFVDDIEHSEQGRNMVATIVTIAHNLDMHVVAEGVETTQQLSFLSELKCEQLQGYLYSKPLKENDFTKYLVAHQITNKSTSFSKF